MGLARMPRGDWKFCASCENCLAGSSESDAYSYIDNEGKYKCTYYNTRVFACSRPRSDRCFSPVSSWNLSDRETAYGLSMQRFYITTAIFKKLGLGFNKDLGTLYAFRENYLESSPLTKGFLSDYDVFGPKIAKVLELSDADCSLSRGLYTFYIEGTLKLIKEDRLDEASELYEAMYQRLKEKFIMPAFKRHEYIPVKTI